MNKSLARATTAVIFGIPTILFLFYGMYGGMPWDYRVTWFSEAYPGWKGFLYDGDKLRIYTSVFYHIGYWISKLIGQTGSWIGYHIIYCILLMAKGFLVFFLCRLIDLRKEIAALAAVLSVLHASDIALGHVGQINQFGISFWILLSMCSFLLFLKQQYPIRYVWLCLAIGSSYMAVWSYEGALFGLLLYPALFLWVRRQTTDPIALGGTLLTTIPAIIYASLWIDRIFGQEWGNTYQAHVIRSDGFHIGAIVGDLWVLVLRLFNFPDWMNNNVWVAGKLSANVTNLQTAYSLIVTLVLLIWFSISLGRSAYLSTTSLVSDPYGTKLSSVHIPRLICVLCVLLISFLLPFLALEMIKISYSRNQIMAAPFASILGAILIQFIFVCILRYIRIPLAVRCTLYSATVLVILTASFLSFASRYQNWNYRWEETRALTARLLQTIPSVQPGTVIMLQNVPITADRWGSNFWFDMLLRLCYPNTKVAGSYSFAPVDPQSLAVATVIQSGGRWITLRNGKSVLVPQGACFEMDGDRVILAETYTPLLIESANINDAIVLEWTDAGPFKIIDDANQIELATSSLAENYHPENRINSPKVSPIASRRFAQLISVPHD